MNCLIEEASLSVYNKARFAKRAKKNGQKGKPDMAGKKKEQATSCETCRNYIYDEDYEYYVCDMDLDEDEMYHFLSSSMRNCPYYQVDNEYLIVRHQM